MEPDWDNMLNQQDKDIKQRETQLGEANKRINALKKINEPSCSQTSHSTHHHYADDHHHNQVHHTGETEAKHDCCIIM